MGQPYICIMLFAETMDNEDRELLERVANAGKNILENLLKKTNIVKQNIKKSENDSQLMLYSSYRKKMVSSKHWM